ESRETGWREIVPGTMMVLFPDVWHRYRPERDCGWSESWISLGGELLFRWQARGLLRADRAIVRLRQPKPVLRQYLEIIEFVARHPEQHPASLSARAMTIVAAVLEQSEKLDGALAESPAEQGGDDPLVRTARQVIWNHSHRKISVAAIAKKVGVTRRTLERSFRSQVGHTVLDDLIACRLERAQRLLRDTHVPIKHVAFAAGFSSLSNMCKVFRREVGLSPGEYRMSSIRSLVERSGATADNASTPSHPPTQRRGAKRDLRESPLRSAAAGG
ncbi:MAG: helix-turn-helix domain-containing protein, partial [Planctomycetota bacterium]